MSTNGISGTLVTCAVNRNTSFTCQRAICISVVSAVTFIAVLLSFYRRIRSQKLIQREEDSLFRAYLRTYGGKQNIILGLAFVQSFLLLLRYLFISDPTLTFFATNLKHMEFLVLVYYFTRHACRITHRSDLVPKYARPTFYFFLCLILIEMVAVLQNERQISDCRDAAWIATSAFGFALAVFFFIIGSLIVAKLGEVTVSGNLRSRKERPIYALMITFFASCLVGFLYDVFFLLEAKRFSDCYFLVTGTQGYTALSTFVRVIDLILPSWALIAAFQPPASSSHHHANGTTPANRPIRQKDGRYTPAPTETAGLLLPVTVAPR